MRLRTAAAAGLCASIGISSALAQGREFGAKAGPNFATVSAVPRDAGYTHRIGIAGGGFAVLPVDRLFGVQIEVLQMPKGTKLGTGDSQGTGKLLLDYLDVAGLARITAPGSAAVHVFAGPYVGFRMRAKLEHAESVSSISVGSRQDISDEVKRTEFGLVVGGGVHIGAHGVIDARYGWGLTDVNRDTTDVRLRHRVASVMAGVRF